MDGLLDIVGDGVETAFSLASELVVTGTFTKIIGNSTYDPVTDTRAEVKQVLTGVRFLRTANDLEQREASPVTIHDSKFLIPGVDLPSLEPGEDDFFTLDTGEKWNVLISHPTPGNKLHIVFARRA